MKNKKCVSYFIKALNTKFVKIGSSNFVSSRKNHLQIGCPFELKILGITDAFTEKELHEKFKSNWVRNEWFELTDEMEKFINENTHIPTNFSKSSEKWSVQISTDIKKILNSHCNERGLKINQFVEKSIVDYMKLMGHGDQKFPTSYSNQGELTHG